MTEASEASQASVANGGTGSISEQEAKIIKQVEVSIKFTFLYFSCFSIPSEYIYKFCSKIRNRFEYYSVLAKVL